MLANTFASLAMKCKLFTTRLPEFLLNLLPPTFNAFREMGCKLAPDKIAQITPEVISHCSYSLRSDRRTIVCGYDAIFKPYAGVTNKPCMRKTLLQCICLRRGWQYLLLRVGEAR
jgi:hypothetical protein